jgi:hypothetical protein
VVARDLDVELREALKWHAGLSEHDPDKHDMAAFVYMTCARAEWRKAEMLRAAAVRAEQREKRRRSRHDERPK